MTVLRLSPSRWVQFLITVLATLDFTIAYRPTQHCKMLGDNGHYSACMSITQNLNATTELYDLYIRYNWYKYKDSKNGWHAFALGRQMAGAFMVLMYGDPTAPYGEMTTSVRSANGHHPPRPILEIEEFQSDQAVGRIPEVEVLTSKIEPYTGTYIYEKLNIAPSHVGIAEVIVRGWDRWIGTAVNSSSEGQPMLWSSNYKQDFSEDFSVDRGLEMHQFGLGFGFMWVDMVNARTPTPMFGPVDEFAGHLGVNEVQNPKPPTAEELAAGEAYIAKVAAEQSTSDTIDPAAGEIKDDKDNPFNDHNTTPNATNADADKSTPAEIPPTNNDDTTQTPPESIEQPVRTLMGKTVRDWMWHLHGALMCLAFLFFYPLGIYYIRNGKPTAFNSHWTIQGLGSVCLGLGTVIGVMQSRSISIWHQYIGILITILITAQIVLGWRHHVSYVAIKRKTALSTIHVVLGRILLPTGFCNIILGMILRRYQLLTLFLIAATIAAESVFLFIYLRRANGRSAAGSGLTDDGTSIKMGDASRAPRGEDAEEYFQLAGDDDDEFSDSDTEAQAGITRKEQEKREQNQRLAKLDRV